MQYTVRSLLEDAPYPCTLEMVNKAEDIIKLRDDFSPKLNWVISKGLEPTVDLAFIKESHSLVFRVNQNLTVDFTYEVYTKDLSVIVQKETIHDVKFPVIKQAVWELVNLHNFSEIRICPFCKNQARIFPREDYPDCESPTIYYNIGCTTKGCYCHIDEADSYYTNETLPELITLWNNRK